ncbi:ImmA/IrrE family metallo-endopeptidase [Streptomyces longwoodensis]|uniref:ImmA/IrrE family metallo-endopeptidase n=1 Tax=Streptomyces longwoodensis TaxID=68231 RepID=UPI0036F846D0
MDLTGFAGGEVHPGLALPSEPVAAARELRRQWGLGDGPVTRLVRRMEAHGIVVVLPAEADAAAATVDAFSSRSARPLVVLTRNRANDVYRHRFATAHELGHLVLHGDATGDSRQEREADAFAAEFLTTAGPRGRLGGMRPNRIRPNSPVPGRMATGRTTARSSRATATWSRVPVRPAGPEAGHGL